MESAHLLQHDASRWISHVFITKREVQVASEFPIFLHNIAGSLGASHGCYLSHLTFHIILRNKTWRPQLTFSRLQFRSIFLSKPANREQPGHQDVSSKFDIKGRAAITSTLVSHRAPNKQHEVHNSCKYLLILFIFFNPCNSFEFKNEVLRNFLNFLLYFC